MNVTQVNSNNYNPQFGNVIVEKGGEKLLKQIAREGNIQTLRNVFRESAENFAADIYVGERNIGVLDKLTGKKYFPSGKLLQEKKSTIARFREAELLEGSSKQDIPLMDASDSFEYLYLGDHYEGKGFFSEPKKIVDYFRPEKESSYVIRQEGVGADFHESKSRLYTMAESKIEQLVAKFNAAIQIAHDIKANAEAVITEKGAAEAVDAFISHLIK